MKLNSERLRVCRTYIGITQGELARRVGVSSSFLSAIERNERRLSPELEGRIVEAFGDSNKAIKDFLEAYEKLNQLKRTE